MRTSRGGILAAPKSSMPRTPSPFLTFHVDTSGIGDIDRDGECY
jgi:hypothetical protein